MIDADDAERGALLEQHAALVGVALAYSLKDQCLAEWNTDRGRAVGAAAALSVVAVRLADPEIDALAAWAAGIAALAEGLMEQAVSALEQAALRFEQLGQRQNAASTNVSKLIALAMLGRYDEAIGEGLAARDVLLAHGDVAAAGRIELNLGHLAFRRDQYPTAEHFYSLARERFLALDDTVYLTKVELGLADVLATRRQIDAARTLYEQALSRAAAAGLEVVQAEAECNLGNLALAQGRYATALDYLERSRRRYAALDMPHESAYADLELAEAYLELNLAPEAAAIFARVIPLFVELGMRSEHAWALAHDGRTALLLGDSTTARLRFAEAHRLFEAEDNLVSAALVALFEAQLLYSEGQFAAASATAASAELVFQRAGSNDRRLLAAWLRGEALRAAGADQTAEPLLNTTLLAAEAAGAPQITQRCATSLGLLAAAQGDLPAAEAQLTRAMTIIERMRAPLPAEEFRTAFLSDKLSPFSGLARICLDTGRTPEALAYVERSRSRALIEMLGGASPNLTRPRDAFEAELIERLATLRQELNWCYQRISRALESDGYDPAASDELQTAAQEREAGLLELTRQLQQRGGGQVAGVSFDLAALQAALDDETALIEYFSLDGELLAFVVTAHETHVIRGLGAEHEVEELVEGLRFQTDALRREVGRNQKHQAALIARTRRYLAQLYDLLLRPLAGLLGERRLAVVPHRALHYVPFQALFDGAQYVIEQREVGTAPSAGVLYHCLQQPAHTHRRAVIVGVPDKRAPRVRDEVLAIAPLWPDRVTLIDAEATLAAVQGHAPSAGVLHLACHGQFRADSPLFSSLRLADGWLTVRDAYELELACDLVVLSACETGVSAVAPGDELIGLARGFFAAGAPSLIVSLWTVDDASTTRLMTSFYRRLQAGERPGAALRQAQCALLRDQPHPFYWAPFVLMGRW